MIKRESDARKAREVVRDSLRLLNRRDRRLLGAAIGVQILTSVLDMVGVLLLGVVGVLSVSAVEGQRPPQRIQDVIAALDLSRLSDSGLIAMFAASAALLLLGKSIVSPILMARVYRFLTRREADVSARLTRQLLARPLTFVQRRSSQKTGVALTVGVSAAVTTVLGQMVVGVAEAALLGALAIVLLVANPALAVGAIAYFAVIGIVLQRVLGRRAAYFGAEQTNSNVVSLRAVQEALETYRELTVADRRSFYADRVHGIRRRGARSVAGAQLVNLLPKYVSEAALVLGAFALTGILFATQSPAAAAGTFVLFLATTSRVMPSLLRLQGAALYLRVAGGSASLTYALAEDLAASGPGQQGGDGPLQPRGSASFVPTVAIQDVIFSYPGAQAPTVDHISLEIAEGQSVALVGRSGAGKSTLADLILGVLQPQTGEVTVGGVPPVDAVRLWPGAVAYVPQDVMLVNDSIRANVALGVPADLMDNDAVWAALQRTQLAEYVHSQPDCLDTQVGEHGLRLSGGQRQRLGLARALYTRPRLLVLDEATSALDAETEKAVSEMLQGLEGNVTTVIIAHRLSTIRHADLVVYLEDGRLLEQGTFDELCARIPALERQAELMGLRLA